jgi:hypothetical protein
VKYINYCPMDMTLDEALHIAKPFLCEGSICIVSPHSVLGRDLKKGETPRAIGYDTYLVQINDDGSTEVVDSKGFN